MRTKLTIIVAAPVAAAGIWGLFVPYRQVGDRRGAFFGTTKQFPTSGGQKMKPE